ncbi:senecionine N-oxygenase-like isoform X1 [Melanaphis sacchari]|uniref:senecionine N-oxygenase-like isoform X1 n=2 Tax=Melanaphis sacchari TaxID=742174 RepID=UPI000DC13D17|nr:senecionine N-oxygenase-like isoform X1 [Melanaphis sacchari]
MRVAIIGAGVAGLASARRCLENDFEPIVYERSKIVGGTWVYEERTGLDEFGLPIHTSMYKNLMTNLPKELMDFPNFPYKGLDDVSYLKWWQVQEYIEKFTEHFGLNKHIQFCTLVTAIERLTNNWQVTVEDLKTKTLKTEYFDAVMVCNGHNAMPFTPDIPGKDDFEGVQIHSHDYRIPEHFTNMNVLIIGSGPSGIDICLDVSKVANQVYFSHHKPELIEKEFSKNVIHFPDVELFSKKSVYFKDKTKQTLDAVIYCTGYKITLPFLKPSCGIKVLNDKLITPLHKNIININNPTMGFIGYLNMTFVFRVFDLQVRYYLEFLRKNCLSRLDYMATMMTPVNTHYLGIKLLSYCKSLISDKIKVEPIPSIFFEIYMACHEHKIKYYRSYHSSVIRIINNNNFVIEFNVENAKNK